MELRSHQTGMRYLAAWLAVGAMLISLTACNTAKYVIHIEGDKCTVDIDYRSKDGAKGIAVVYSDDKKLVKEVRILYCTPPKQDEFRSADSEQSLNLNIKDRVEAAAKSKIATEKRKTSNHTTASILVDYALYRICELIVAGKVNPEQAQDLLDTVLRNTEKMYKSINSYADADKVLEDAIDKMFDGKDSGAPDSNE